MVILKSHTVPIVSGAYRYGAVHRYPLGGGGGEIELEPRVTQPLDELLEQQLGPALGPVVQALGDYICRRMQGTTNQGDGWVDQSHGCKILGRNKWIKAVRDRLERDPDDPHARIVGDQYLLDAVGVSEERDRAHKARPVLRKTEPAPDESVNVTRALRLLRGEK